VTVCGGPSTTPLRGYARDDKALRYARDDKALRYARDDKALGYARDDKALRYARDDSEREQVSTELIVLPPERNVPCSVYFVAEMRSNVTARFVSG